jgi:ABC-2 type transport system ATP-binding protein
MVGLDPRSARLVKDLLRSRARGGATVFMSTHTLFVAEEIADCIGIIDHGRLLFLGGLEELRAVRSTSLEQFFLELTANGRAGEDPAPISISPLPPGEG